MSALGAQVLQEFKSVGIGRAYVQDCKILLMRLDHELRHFDVRCGIEGVMFRVEAMLEKCSERRVAFEDKKTHCNSSEGKRKTRIEGGTKSNATQLNCQMKFHELSCVVQSFVWNSLLVA